MDFLSRVKKYVDDKYVRMVENGDLALFNYSEKCTYGRVWDDITLQCRGLIVNRHTGEVVERPFPKFFNLGEQLNYGQLPQDLTYQVFEKVDGSLGILYRHEFSYRIATRGSFTSEQALWATDFIQKFDLTGLIMKNGPTEYRTNDVFLKLVRLTGFQCDKHLTTRVLILRILR